MDCHFLLQGIFPTQGLNPGLLHCRQTLYCLSHLRVRGFQIQIPMGKADSRSEQSSPRMIQLGTVGPGGNWKASQLVPCNNAYVGIEIASFFKQCQRSGFLWEISSLQFSSVQSLSCVQLFATPWTAACQASLSIANSSTFLF